nr:DNA polymerase-like [Ipomoea batatas]
MPLTRAVFRITGERKRPGADLPLRVGLAIGFVARSSPRCSSQCITPINEARSTPRSQGLEDPSPKGVVATFCATTDSDDLLHSPLPNTAETNGSKQGRAFREEYKVVVSVTLYLAPEIPKSRSLCSACGRVGTLANVSWRREQSHGNWSRLMDMQGSELFYNLYTGSLLAENEFVEPYARSCDYVIISLEVLRLLYRYAYNMDSDYIKFTIGLVVETSSGIYRLTVGKAIPLFDSNGAKPGFYIAPPSISNSDILSLILDDLSSSIIGLEVPEAKSMNKEKPRYSNHITAIKPKTMKLRPFIVADTETLLDEKSHAHVPYAVGYMLVSPRDDVGSKADYEIEPRFSESHVKFLPKMEDRSKRMMFEFLNSLERTLTINKSVRTVYFHNLAKFDGIFFMRHYVERTDNIYRFKPLIRNHMLYELKVHKGRKLLMRFRDSCNLLPGSLASLAERLCPQLGPKGSIQHQEIYIEELMTLSSLATRIFRMKYYDEKRFPIHIPNRNEDTFIRRGYYGSHTDAYIPSGENLYYYDVNSLYPFIMKTYPMPGGVPVWRGNLEGERLDDLQFAGVYYSEEFQYARDLGYTIIPLRGYLFEKKASPFEAFVSELYGSRQRAKKEGDEAMSYVYKTLMNSLYGRFGINPVSTVTELCDTERYEEFLRKDNFTFLHFNIRYGISGTVPYSENVLAHNRLHPMLLDRMPSRTRVKKEDSTSSKA